MSDALVFRSRAAADEYRRGAVSGQGRPDQAVFKVIGSRSDPAGVRQLLAYVSRSGAWATRYNLGQPLPMRTETGEIWQPGRAGEGRPLTEALAEYWGLPDEHDLAWRQQRLERMAPGRERRPPALAWHLTVSIKRHEGWGGPGGDLAREDVFGRLEEAVRGFVFEAFAQPGWRVLWVLHADGSHPHAHLMVRAENDLGGRLRFDRHGDALDHYREIFTRHARSCGIDVTAERREDREEVRRAVLNGEAEIRPHVTVAEKHRAEKAERRELPLQVPLWYQTEGEAYERRRIADAERRLRAEGAPNVASRRDAYVSQLPAMPARVRGVPEEFASDQAMIALFDRIKGSFTDPESALRSYARMCTEAATRDNAGVARYPRKALADWYMRNQPLAFGEITGAALLHRGDRDLKQLLRRVRPDVVYEPVLGDLKKLMRVRGQAEQARHAVRLVTARRVMAQSLDRLATRTEQAFGASDRVQRIRSVAQSLLTGARVQPGRVTPRGTIPVQGAEQGRRPAPKPEVTAPGRPDTAASEQKQRGGLLNRLLGRNRDENGR